MPTAQSIGSIQPLAFDAAELSTLLADLDITNREAAYYAGVNEATIYRWLNGSSPIPHSVTRMFKLQLYVKRGSDMIRVIWSSPED